MVFFTRAFHGMTPGSLAVTGNRAKRDSAAQPLANATVMPYDGYLGEGIDTVDYLRRMLEDGASGLDLPAAVILETVQGEGGIQVASNDWLRRLAALCREHGILLIVDDIQVGCGRTGDFFSFEAAGIKPDIVTLSKSLSGYGQPLAVVLLRPELDVWAPGEHNGTFRGNNLAFVTATAATDFWRDDTITREVEQKGPTVRDALERIAANHPELEACVRGRGFVWGMECARPGAAGEIAQECYRLGLLVETAGPDDEVLKFLAPVTIAPNDLAHGLELLDEAAKRVIRRARRDAA